MRKRILTLPAVALALGLIGSTPAHASSGHSADHSADHGTDHGAASTAEQAEKITKSGKLEKSERSEKSSNRVASDTANSKAVFLTAKLNGANEVPVADGPAVGDPDGKGVALVKVKGNQVTFGLDWTGISAPSLGHIHEGAAGANGAVKVTLFGTAMPETVRAAAGKLTVTDPQIATAIRANPAGFYVNLHSAEFPGGALRGQLSPLKKPLDVMNVMRSGKLRALLSGDQEVPAGDGKAVGDPDGFASAIIRPKLNSLDFSLAWVGITAPTLGHIHQGRFGANGAVKVNLLGTAVPDTVFAVSGTAPGLDPALTNQIRKSPKDFYVNVHTKDFPGGAVRGQCFS